MCIISTQFLSAQMTNLKGLNPFENTLVLSVDGGLTLGQTDYRSARIGVIAKGAAEYFWSVGNKHILGLKLVAGGMTLRGEDVRKIPEKISTDILSFGGGLSYSYVIFEKYMPYVSFTYQNLWFSPKDDNGKRAPNNSKNLYEKTAGIMNIEIGCRYIFNDFVTFNASGSIFLPETDFLDDFKSGTNKDLFMNFSVGASIALFGKRDRDGDGILDNLDKCPDEPEDFDDFADGDGCPELDNDNDGIPDIKDKCPDSAEDKDGFEDGDGCPDEDNDNDGIIDYLDKCPDEPEDFDGIEDSDGCPDYDNDGDGIDDSVDKCPDEREIFNGFEDEDGCPDERKIEVDTSVVMTDIQEVSQSEKELDKEIEKVILPQRNVPDEFLIQAPTTFNPGTAEINPEAVPYLVSLVDSLKKYPVERWRIEGHIDSRTAGSGDADLSYKMAKAVQEFFISKGLPSSRFIIVDMSDRVPLASNTTTFGRMKNRRVIIVRVR